MNAKSQTEAFEEAVTTTFEFENPDELEQEIMAVASQYQHLKLMAADIDRFTFCDFDQSKEVSVAWLDLLDRQEKPANFLNNAAAAYDCSKQQVQKAIEVQKWDNAKHWQEVCQSAIAVLDLLASWRDIEENQSLGGYEEEDSLMLINSDSDDVMMYDNNELLLDDELLQEGEVTSLFEDGVVVLLPLVGGTPHVL